MDNERKDETKEEEQPPPTSETGDAETTTDTPSSPSQPQPSSPARGRLGSPLLRSAASRAGVDQMDRDNFLALYRDWLRTSHPHMSNRTVQALAAEVSAVMDAEFERNANFRPRQWLAFGSPDFVQLAVVTDFVQEGTNRAHAMLMAQAHSHLIAMMLNSLQKHEASRTLKNYKALEAHLKLRKTEARFAYNRLLKKGQLKASASAAPDPEDEGEPASEEPSAQESPPSTPPTSQEMAAVGLALCQAASTAVPSTVPSGEQQQQPPPPPPPASTQAEGLTLTVGNLYTAYVSTLRRECNIYVTGFIRTESGELLVQARPVCYADRLLYHTHEIRPLQQGAAEAPTGRDVTGDVIDGTVSGTALAQSQVYVPPSDFAATRPEEERIEDQVAGPSTAGTYTPAQKRTRKDDFAWARDYLRDELLSWDADYAEAMETDDSGRIYARNSLHNWIVAQTLERAMPFVATGQVRLSRNIELLRDHLLHFYTQATSGNASSLSLSEDQPSD